VREGRWKSLARGLPLVLLAMVLWREKPLTVTVMPELSARAAWTIAAAILLNFSVCLPLKAARWRLALSRPPPFREALAATLEGLLAGAALGFGSGDLVRAARIRRPGRELALDYACTWAERGAETFALALLVFATALVTSLGTLALGLSGLAMVGYLAVLGTGRILAPRLVRWPRCQRLLSAVVQASTPGKVAAIAGLSLLGWASEGAMLVLFQRLFGLEPSAGTAALTLVGINAAIAIPLAPGNFGTFEAGATLALVSAGVPRELAISYAVIYHLTHVLPVAVVATGVYLARRWSTTPSRTSIGR